MANDIGDIKSRRINLGDIVRLRAGGVRMVVEKSDDALGLAANVLICCAYMSRFRKVYGIYRESDILLVEVR